MIWIATAALLTAWFIGLLLRLGQPVHVLLLAAAVLLVAQVIRERGSEG